MTGEAIVLGKRADGTVRRYAMDVDLEVIHVIATRTGVKTYCGQKAVKPLTPSPARARAIDARLDEETRGFSFCPECRHEMVERPDPGSWGPPLPKRFSS